MSLVGGTPRDMRLQQLSMRHKLKQGLSSLPKPKETEWELEIPEDQQEVIVRDELEEDAEVMWKDISADVTLTSGAAPAASAHTHGPKVTTLESARYGDRPFPVVTGKGTDSKRRGGVSGQRNPPGCYRSPRRRHR